MNTLSRRHWLTRFASALLFATLPAFSAEPAEFVKALTAGKKQTIITYGTSLTAGGAWVGQLQKELESRFPANAKVINSGQGAMWSKWGLDHLDERVISKSPDAVLIEWSINDAFLEYKTSTEDCRANLNTMIDRILAAHPKCEIILEVMNPPTGEHLQRRPKIAEYEQVYRDVAKARNLRLVDHAPQWAGVLAKGDAEWKALAPDGIHPNAEGCKQIITPFLIKTLGL